MIKRLKVKIIWQEEELEKGMARCGTGIINYKPLVKQLKLIIGATGYHSS